MNIEEVWIVTSSFNGFVFKTFIRSTEEKLRSFIDTELKNWTNYVAATDNQVNMANQLNMPIYCY